MVPKAAKTDVLEAAPTLCVLRLQPVKSGRLTSLATCAFIALMVACLVGSPRGERAVDCEKRTDVASAIDASQGLPPHDGQPLDARPIDRSATFVNQPGPCSRLTISEVFRPPQART